MNYSVIAEGNDTFVLKVNRQSLNNEFPAAVVEAIKSSCLNRENRLRNRIKAVLFEN